MRIVGGKYRGKKLLTPNGKNVRPTSERVREAVFNILYSMTGGDYAEFNLIDVFCGTGAFGFEALSRGFASVVFIDLNTKLVKQNARFFTAENSKISIKQLNATKLPWGEKKYNILFSDAPYAKGLTEKALSELVEKQWLTDDVLYIIEVRKDEKFEGAEEFEITDERIYGLAKILFLRRKKFFLSKNVDFKE